MKTIKKAIMIKGATLQQVVVMEEMAELTQCISKLIRGKGSIEHLVEEMADVYICLDMLKVIYGIEEYELRKWQKKKIDRLEMRLEKGEA